MGSQQLLLIVLGIIIVGLAVIIGMSVFGQQAREANKDAIAQDLIRMGAAAQAYFEKPTTTGGGSRSFAGIQLKDMGAYQINESYDGAAAFAENHNARYVVRSADATSCVVEGVSVKETGTDGKPARVSITITSENIQLQFPNWD